MKSELLPIHLSSATSNPYLLGGRRIAAAVSYLVMVMGLLVLAGWQFDIPFFKHPIPSLVSMNPLTAVCFLLSSMLLPAYLSPNMPIATRGLRLVSLGVVALTGYNLLASYAPLLPGIDDLLYRKQLQQLETSNPMSPITAFNFLLWNASFLFLVSGSFRIRKWVHLAIVLTSYFALLGYLFQASEFYSKLNFFPMAPHTALGFILLVCAMELAFPSGSWTDLLVNTHEGSRMARVLLPLAIFTPLVLGMLRLAGQWSAIYSNEFGTALLVIAVTLLFAAASLKLSLELGVRDLRRSEYEKEIAKINFQLKETNEEVVTLNEELTATNEELTAANEELFANNEELSTLNEQLNLANEAINTALEKERELVNMKQKFISIASHEFRTPLATIRLTADMIGKYNGKMSSETLYDKLENISKQVEHMTHLLDDVLIVGKTEEGKIEVLLSRVDAKAVISEIAAEVVESAGADRRIDFQYLSAQRYIETDTKLIRNILINLLSNAIKFSHPSQPVNLTVRDNRQGFYELIVQDHGIGIPEEDQEKLFDSFTRASNAGQISGSGLGLYIVKKAVHLLNGQIAFESTIDEGTVFTVRLPVEGVRD